MNVDASFSETTFQASLGIVLKDEAGGFVVFPGRVDTDVNEAMGFVEALDLLGKGSGLGKLDCRRGFKGGRCD